MQMMATLQLSCGRKGGGRAGGREDDGMQRASAASRSGKKLSRCLQHVSPQSTHLQQLHDEVDQAHVADGFPAMRCSACRRLSGMTCSRVGRHQLCMHTWSHGSEVTLASPCKLHLHSLWLGLGVRHQMPPAGAPRHPAALGTDPGQNMPAHLVASSIWGCTPWPGEAFIMPL